MVKSGGACVPPPGEIVVYRTPLDLPGGSTSPADRRARSHRVLYAILESLGLPTSISRDHRNKPYLSARRDIHFNLSRSYGLGLVALSSGGPVGVDIERIRPLAEWQAIAERFFPPSRYAELLETPPEERPLHFFRVWTRLEASLKALGVGLYGAGAELEGEWSILDLDAAEGFAAAAAAPAPGWRVVLRDFC